MNQDPNNPYENPTPQRESGTGLRLLITLGGLAFTVIGALVLAINLFTRYAGGDSRRDDKGGKTTAAKPPSTSISPDSPGGMTGPNDPVEPPGNTEPAGTPEVRSGNLAGKYMDVVRIPNKYGKAVYYIGLYKNTGKAVLRKPRLQLEFLDDDGNVVNTRKYYSYGARGRIAPDDSVPFRIRVAEEPAHKSWRIIHEPKRPYSRRPRLNMEIKNARIGAPVKYRGHQVTGTITNKDQHVASLIKLIATVRCDGGKICGHNTWYLSRKTLNPGESSQFKFFVRNISGKPSKLVMDYTGWVKRTSSSPGSSSGPKSGGGGSSAWPE